MAELFLDIHDTRCVRALISDNGAVVFKNSYHLRGHHSPADADTPAPPVESWLPDILATIKSECGTRIDQVHLVLSSSDVDSSTHKLPNMPADDARKLISRKIFNTSDDDAPRLHLIPMSVDQSGQEWRAECIQPETLKSYGKIFSAARLKLKSVCTALDAMLLAATDLRESIFNAHAIIEINSSTVEIFYLSATNLLSHESLTLSAEEELPEENGGEQSSKKRTFALLDLLYHANSRYTTEFPMIPVQKVWLCGTDSTITDLSAVLLDAMDVETQLLADIEESVYVPLTGLLKGHLAGRSVNLISPDMLRRFPLRKQSGMLVYVVTALLSLLFVVNTEQRHRRQEKRALANKNALAAQKNNQAAMTAITKNLEQLRRLTGGQITFYPIFKELAMNLPDGTYLDSFNFSGKENQDSIELTVVFPHTNDLGTRKTLSRLTDVMKQSPYLSRYRDPSIVSTATGQKKIMTVKFTSEVKPHDTEK